VESGKGSAAIADDAVEVHVGIAVALAAESLTAVVTGLLEVAVARVLPVAVVMAGAASVASAVGPAIPVDLIESGARLASAEVVARHQTSGESASAERSPLEKQFQLDAR